MNCNIKKGTKGVYLIRNKTNGKVYIGSSKDIQKRITQHFRQLKQNNHHSIELQLDFNKYGIENFQIEVLLECSISDARKYEEEYIEKFNLKQFGYNQGYSVETLRKKDKLFKDRLFNLLKDLGYKNDGKVYWFDIFKISRLLEIKVTDVLNKFGINNSLVWTCSIDMGNGEFISLNYDNDYGVQIIAFHESYFNLSWEEKEDVYVDI